MSTKNITRVSLDMPRDYHDQLKMLAASQRKTMRQIILESIDAFITNKVVNDQVPENERWLYDPANKELVKKLDRGLKQKATIYRGSFAKYTK